MTGMDWWTQILTAGTGSVRRGRHDGERYVALPAGDPRVVVDAGNRRALADATRRFGSRRGSRSIAATASAVAAVLPAVGPVWTVRPGAGDGSTLRTALSNAVGEAVDLSIAVGPERVNRKPVVRCYVGDRVVAFAKLGPDPHTAALVRNEGRWLRSFAENGLGDVATPSVRHEGLFGPHPLLVTDPLDVDGLEPKAIADMPSAVLAALRARGARGVGLAESPWWSRLAIELADVAGNELAAVEDAPEFGAISWSTWHGDWSPWNVGTDRRGRICVWDWERTEEGAPDHLDPVHLHYQYGGGLDAARAALEATDLPTGHHDVLVAGYLLELMCRHRAADRLGTETALIDRSALAASVARLGGKRTA